MRTETDIAWAAGLFGGEGSAYISNARQPAVSVAMTDEDIVARFASIVGCGNVRDYHRPPNKRYWLWSAQSRDDVIEVLTMLTPYLGYRRSEAAEKVLARAREMRALRGHRSHCKRGHALVGDAIYVHAKTGKRQCRTCRNDYSRRRSS